MRGKILLQDMTWAEAEVALKKSIIIVPVGATEQHGLHLPIGTDSLVTFEILMRTAQRIADRIKLVVIPLINIGMSYEHLDFPGTLSLKNAASLMSYVKEVTSNLIRHGAKKILFFNGHGGNTPSLIAVTREIRVETGAFAATADWEDLAVENLPEKLIRTYTMHADELETSVMLFLFPELVHMEKAVKELPQKFLNLKHFKSLGSSLSYPSWVTKDVSRSGVIGDPTEASKEKGRKIVEAAIEGTCSLLEEMAALNV